MTLENRNPLLEKEDLFLRKLLNLNIVYFHAPVEAMAGAQVLVSGDPESEHRTGPPAALRTLSGS